MVQGQRVFPGTVTGFKSRHRVPLTGAAAKSWARSGWRPRTVYSVPSTRASSSHPPSSAFFRTAVFPGLSRAQVRITSANGEVSEGTYQRLRGRKGRSSPVLRTRSSAVRGDAVLLNEGAHEFQHPGVVRVRRDGRLVP